MKRLLLQLCILFLSSSLYAYPTTIKKTVDLSIAQATDGMVLSDNDRYLIIAAGETIKVIDLAKYALASSQPPELSEDDDTDGNIGGMVFIPENNAIYASQDDGDVLKMDLDTITETPESTTIATGKTLTLMAADTSGASPTLYILNNADKIIYIYAPESSSAAVGVALTSAITDVSFSILDILYVSATDELYIATDAGRILYINSSGDVGSPINIDIANGDDFAALTASEDGSKVYAVNSTDGTIEVITASTHDFGTPIPLEQNSELKDITLMDIASPDGATYGFVSGQDGISIFDTEDNSVIDLDDSNDEGLDDPISTTYVGYLITSTDGYTYMSSGGGEISVITEKPFITLTAPTYADSDAASATALQSGGTFTLSFQSDVAGTYEIRSGGDLDESGTLLTDTNGATSGSVVAATDTSVSFSYSTNSSLLSEGPNTVFVFVTDADSLTGRAAATVTVDTPPTAITLNSTGFGNGRVYATFTRLTAADIDYYNIYVDTDEATVQTKTDASSTADQPSSGDSVTAEVGGLTNDATYYIAVEAVDSNANVGPRAYLLSDGMAASAIPQRTVGPAGLSGETGCSLILGGDSRNIIFSIIVILLPLLFIMWRRVCLMLALGIFVFCGSAFAKTSPQWWSAELKTGLWMPTDNVTEQFFDKCCNMVFSMNGGYLYKGKYGFEAGAGFMTKDGTAVGSSTSAISADKFNLTLVPMETNLVWRIDYAEEQIVVPYIKSGFDYVFFRENVKGDTTKGFKTGFHSAGGLQFLMKWLDSDESMALDYGINDFYIVMEARYNWINDFGGGGLDLSGPIYSAGLLFEF